MRTVPVKLFSRIPGQTGTASAIDRAAFKEKTMSSTFVLRQTGPCRFEFTLNTHNGRLLLTSRAYPDKETALRRIDAKHSLMRNNRNYVTLTAEISISSFSVMMLIRTLPFLILSSSWRVQRHRILRDFGHHPGLGNIPCPLPLLATL